MNLSNDTFCALNVNDDVHSGVAGIGKNVHAGKRKEWS